MANTLTKNGRKDVLYQPVTLETIDQAIHDWFNLVVDSHVDDTTGMRRKVSVVMASGERAVTAKEKKGIRDENGVIILPIISLRRTAIARDAKMSALGVETPNIQISRLLSLKTNLIQDLNQGNNLTGPNPKPQSSRVSKKAAVYEVTTIPFPDRSILTYEVVVQAQYTVQMNAILEKIFSLFDLQQSFVAPFDYVKKQPLNGTPFEDRPPLQSAYCVGFFQGDVGDSGNFEDFTDQERIVQYTAQVTVPANLNLDPEGEKPAIHVERTVYAVAFEPEVVQSCTPEELEEIFSSKRRS
ncbi:MAG: hypothetical protein ACYDHY_07730 [Acidiferrobacterales bacterium]